MPLSFPCSVMPWRSANDSCCSSARLDKPRLKVDPSRTSRPVRKRDVSILEWRGRRRGLCRMRIQKYRPRVLKIELRHHSRQHNRHRMLDDLFLVQPESSAGSGKSCKRLKKCSESTFNANDLSAFVFKRQHPQTQDVPLVKAGSLTAKALGDAVSGIDTKHVMRETQPAKAKDEQHDDVRTCALQATNAAHRAPAAKKIPAAKKSPAAKKTPAAAARPAEISKRTPQTSSQKTIKPECLQSTLQPDAIPSYGPPIRHEGTPHFFGGRHRSVLLSFAYVPAPKELAPEATVPCLHSRWGGAFTQATPAKPVRTSPVEPSSARVTEPPPSRPDTQESSGVSCAEDEHVAAPAESAGKPARTSRCPEKGCKQAESSVEALPDSGQPPRHEKPEGARPSRRARATVNYSEVADGESDDESEVRSFRPSCTSLGLPPIKKNF